MRYVYVIEQSWEVGPKSGAFEPWKIMGGLETWEEAEAYREEHQCLDPEEGLKIIRISRVLALKMKAKRKAKVK